VNAALREELLKMEAEDLRVRAELAADGSLFEGYHPRMEQVHRQNAERLMEIVGIHGWPGKTLVGEDGTTAAWRIAQHAISLARVQRRCLALLEEAAARGQVPAWQPAYLTDRILTLEGRPQIYGTQFDDDENGDMMPLPIEDPGRVHELRRALGLPPLADLIKETRRNRGRRPAGEKPAERWKRRQREAEEWARSVGWRD
jgi:hypothetical protein